MFLIQAYHILLVIFLSLTTTSIGYSNYAKPGCNDRCGNVRIPYPFGIGANCSVNEWYVVECNSSTPYLSALNDHLEVLGVDLENQTIVVNMPKFTECFQTKKVDLGRSPFLLLESYNKVMDDSVALLWTLSDRDKDQTKKVDLGKSPFLLLESYNKVMDDSVALLWTLSDRDKDQVSCCDNYNPKGYRRKVDMGNGTSVETWKCAYYEFYEGTPYLRDGCEDYPTVTEECARCEDSDGYCHYDTIYDLDGLVYSQNFTCRFYGDYNTDESRSSKLSMGVLIANCSVNEWYIVECNSSTPYLSALNHHLEVLGVDLENQTIVVNMPKFTECFQTKKVDLGKSPFLLLESYNKVMDDSVALLWTLLDRDKDQATMAVRVCVVKKKSRGSFGQRRFSGKSFIPTSLLWTLGHLDLKQVNCCNTAYMDTRTVDLSSGTSVDTLKCSMDNRPLNENPYLFDGCYDTEECARCMGNGRGYYCHYKETYDIDGLFNKWNFTCDDYSFLAPIIIASSIAVLGFAKPGCNDTCGKVSIPYPFGIGANCSVNKWYTIDCNSSTPYLSALNHLEVVGVDLESQIISVNMQKLSACSQATKSVNLASSPFLYSKSHNKFVVEGCGNGVILGDHGIVLSGCSITCSNHTTTSTAVTINTNNTRFGINCCETTIPHYLNSYSVNLTGLERLNGDRACGSAFLVDKNLYDEVRFSGKSFIPTSLLWTLGHLDLKQVNCCNTAYMDTRTVDLSSGTSVDTLKCSMDNRPLNGNPYLFDGCYDTEECARCMGNGRGYYCHYKETYDIDGLFNKWNFTCDDYSFLAPIIIDVETTDTKTVAEALASSKRGDEFTTKY
ncbi:wall-associated receptor kinase [Artemisia annua]|uniref:Wall-associated receptor kinase n=1 Tax=Artemisia annua TaxID=35608 RepID=A0A2U1L6L1_ARTAN|nr:wall-associated receptor kinase [Artemisia annua]